MDGGAAYTFDVYRGDEIVGTTTVTINKKVRPWAESTTYAIGALTFRSLAEFKAAIAADNPEKKP
jgi:hypothetical protein